MRSIFISIFLIMSSLAQAATYYVATNGSDSNSGSITSPFATWQKGFTVAQPGDIVYVRGGTYYPKGVWGSDVYSGVYINAKNGSSGKMINIWAYPGEKPILDCKDMTQAESHMGVYLRECSYWYLKGLTIKNAIQTPGYGAHGLYLRAGNYNRFEQIDISFIGGSGLCILYNAEKNYIYNCDVHDCFDQYTKNTDGTANPGEHADGIDFADITERSGNERVNTLRGVRSWNNSDDGFDHYRYEGILIIDSCWVWHNGYNYGGTTPTGDGNGFKLGLTTGTPESVAQRTVTNCISYGNRQRGYSQEDANVNMIFYNNIAYKNNLQGFAFVAYDRPDILRNNIAYRNSADGAFKSKQTHDHNSWDSGVTVSDADFQSLDATQLAKPRKANGSLPDITFLALASGSDMIDKGVNVNFAYSGKSPDLGPFETGGTATTSTLSYVSSVVESATPSTLTMTYSSTLASILPDPAKFAVMVNSVSRTVSSISISGAKVMLKLSSSVAGGDVVTVAYTKPTSNLLQSTGGSQAPTMLAMPVTNNVSAAPVYISSVIQSSAPSLLEMTFNLSLASVIPVASSFAVMVNSVARAVNAVAISGTKVILTLSSPVSSGNTVTVAYTKPATNPLQGTSSGQVASISAKSVPIVSSTTSGSTMLYLNSVVENVTPSILTINYNLDLSTTILPDVSRFAVRVNSVIRTVNSYSISGTKVILSLANPIAKGDIVTVGYIKPTTNLLQSTGGSVAPNMTDKPVTNNVSLLGPTYLSAVIQDPRIIQLNYSLELAPVIPPASSFSITVDSDTINVNAVEISGSQVLITLETPVASGDNVTLDYTVPTSNPIQTTTSGTASDLDDISVANTLTAVIIPEYLSSVVEDISPNVVELTYTIDLANAAPESSAFIAKINGDTKPIKGVTINGNKVTLTLQANITKYDNVTITYNTPSINPLQAISGGKAFAFADLSVTNNTSNEEISIFPNPASDFINISNLEPTAGSRLIRIFDFSGKLCLEKLLDSDSENRIPINLRSGIYVVQIVLGPIVKYAHKLVIR